MLQVGSEKGQDASSYWSEIIGQARSYRHAVTAYCRDFGNRNLIRFGPRILSRGTVK